MDTKKKLKKYVGLIVILLTICSCEYPYCPPMPNSATGGINDEFVVNIELVNRKDTINVGDTLLFKSPQPILPLVFNNTLFDEHISIEFLYSFSAYQVGTANNSFIQFVPSNQTLQSQAPYENYIKKKRELFNNENFSLGFIAKDTGIFYFHLTTFDGVVNFSESNVPGYKGRCDRSTNHFRISIDNLREQPLANQLNMSYREVFCAGTVCDTQVVAYAFRVVP